MVTKEIKGNKGEWSELYVLLRLLADGKIHAANDKVEKINNIFFPIKKIIREDVEHEKYEYVVNNKIKSIEIFLNNALISNFKMNEFKEEADYLYSKILSYNSSSFKIQETEKFMKIIGCTKITASSKDKTDITMQIHDIQTGFDPIYGFSIKSEIGSAPTLLNASRATNFKFEVKGLNSEQMHSINEINTDNKVVDRMERIFNEATEINFVKSNNVNFERNMMLIDSRLDELIAYTLLYYYRDKHCKCNEIIEIMEQNNPMGYPNTGFYEYKFKKFLCSVALGMMPSKIWNGIDEANGGYIIVTRKGDVLAYHIYNRADFEKYLLNTTKYEKGSTNRHDYAKLYIEEDKMFVNLNLQVRFI